MNQELTGSPIEEYRPTEAALVELRQRHAGVVYPVNTPKGLAAAKAARAELRDLRVALEKTRKVIKEPALRRSQQIDTEARRITAALSELEDPIDAQIKAEEQRKEDERRAREQAEQQRIATIRARIAGFNEEAGRCIGQPSVVIRTKLERLQGAELTEALYNELLPEAQEAHALAVAAVAEHLDRQTKHEAEQAQIAAERAELEKLREEAAARDRAEAERRAEQERRDREKRDEEERAQAAERERVARNDAAIRKVRDSALEFVSAPSNMIADEVERLTHDPSILETVDPDFLPELHAAITEAADKLRELQATAEDRERQIEELRQQRERQEQERAAEEARRAEERRQLDAERARVEAETLAQVTLHDAAQSALDWFNSNGHGQLQVARMLAAALSRDVAEAA